MGTRRARRVRKRTSYSLQRRVDSRHGLAIRRIGSDYGGWTIPVDALRPGSVCYCAGVGEDATFDMELATGWGAEVWSFDPTPTSIAYVQREEDIAKQANLHFLPVGIWSEDTSLYFGPPKQPGFVSYSVLRADSGGFEAPCRSLRSLAEELGHDTIALVKLDIEGAEWAVLPALLAEGPLPTVLCVELHLGELHLGGGNGRREAVRVVDEYVARAGYRVVAVESLNVTLFRPRATGAPRAPVR
jgi:FkbM family methyltransferase